MEIKLDDYVGRTAPKCKVLLVDDDAFIHEMMALLLAKTEFSLSSAKSVAEAMKMIVSDAPDIVITDAMMPGESGFGLIQKIKSSPISSGIPVILWTILEQPDGSVMDASGKADILTNKPFYSNNILESLAKAKQMIAAPPFAGDVTFSVA